MQTPDVQRMWPTQCRIYGTEVVSGYCLSLLSGHLSDGDQAEAFDVQFPLTPEQEAADAAQEHMDDVAYALLFPDEWAADHAVLGNIADEMLAQMFP